MVEFFQAILDGLLKGLLYSLVAQSFMVVYRTGRIFNFAQGELVLISGLITYYFFVHFGAVPAVVVLMVVAFCLAFAFVMERLIFRMFETDEDLFRLVMATISLIFIFRGMVLLFWGGEEIPFPPILGDRILAFGPFAASEPLLKGAAISLFSTLMLTRFFSSTLPGLRLSAIADDYVLAQSLGVPLKAGVFWGWFMASLLAVLAAVVLLSGASAGLDVTFIGIQAIPVALLAGMESIGWAPIAGIAVGIGESLSAAYMGGIAGGVMTDLFPFLMIVLALIMRPSGFSGWTGWSRA